MMQTRFRCPLMTQSGDSPLPRPDHASSSKKRFAIINAWLLAKVMATAEIFHVADNLKHEPLIYPVVFKSVVFAALLVSFYLLEEVLVGLWHGKLQRASQR